MYMENVETKGPAVLDRANRQWEAWTYVDGEKILLGTSSRFERLERVLKQKGFQIILGS